MPSYTDLSIYRKCPRLYGFKLLGYTSIETPEPMQTGQFVHAAVAAHFRGKVWQAAINTASSEATVRLGKIEDNAKQAKALKELDVSIKRAEGLADRYIEHWTGDYTAPLVETELKLGNVVCHIDLIAYYAESRVIVDYKTSKSPDMRWYDVSGQVDLYAYVFTKCGIPSPDYPAIDLIIYDVISEEGIFRHTRPPRLEAGKRLYEEIEILSEATKLVPDFRHFLEHPGFTYDCPNRCQFWIPCWLLETADWSACEDYLKSNFLREEK